jgi:hypothetical protein
MQVKWPKLNFFRAYYTVEWPNLIVLYTHLCHELCLWARERIKSSVSNNNDFTL